ncbi:MAG: hydrogenase maturation protease [Solirubrobacteraceae bacterium]
MPADVVVIGVGNELRGDDGAGPLVMRRLRDAGLEVAVCHGGTELLDLWHGASAAILVDAVATGAPAGTIHRFDLGALPLRSIGAPSGTHALSVSDTVELARTLGRLPPRVIVYGIEVGRLGLGEPMSAEVSAALPLVAQRVRGEVAALA